MADDVEPSMGELVARGMAGQPASADRGKPGTDDGRAIARRAQVVQLRLAGLTYEQIAERVGYGDKASARQTFLRAMREVEAENVTELRQVENARLERATAAIWTKVLSGDPKAIEVWLKISERLSRLNGLDAPTQVAISTGVRSELADALALLRDTVLGEVTHVVDDLADGPGGAAGTG